MKQTTYLAVKPQQLAEKPFFCVKNAPKVQSVTHHKHLLTGEELSSAQIHTFINTAIRLKVQRRAHQLRTDLSGQQLALIFDKQSLRTRFSFTIAMRELGGDVIESIESTRKSETPEDYAHVLSGYCHGIMIRTHADDTLQQMARVAKVPIINGLSNLHHPCQVLADLLTLTEYWGELSGLTLTYIGDGNNMLHSFLLLAPQMGINVHYSCPSSRQPDSKILARALTRTTSTSGKIKAFLTPQAAVRQAQAVYTDVWTSMGFEAQRADHIFEGFQVNEALMAHADQNAIFMHCLPMERDKEVSNSLADSACSVVFQQSENRLHIQKALLLDLLK